MCARQKVFIYVKMIRSCVCCGGMSVTGQPLDSICRHPLVVFSKEKRRADAGHSSLMVINKPVNE